AYWLLDRDGIKGHFGESQLKPPAEDEDEETEEQTEPEPPKGIGAVGIPDRHIYCLDLRDFKNHAPYVEEVRRIAAECRERHESRQKEKGAANPALVQLGVAINAPNPASGGREPPVPSSTGADPLVRVPPAPLAEGTPFSPDQLLKAPERRWYPV